MKCFKLCLVVAVLVSGMAQAALVHQYTFNDGTANDYVGGASGTLMGTATVVPNNNGTLVTDAEGDYLNLPGAAIALNTYEAVTLEVWSTQFADQGWTMLAAFGNTVDGWHGVSYLALSTSRQDNVTRAMLTTLGGDSEVGVNGPELNDGILHQYVVTVGPAPAPAESLFDQTVITLFIDGVCQGMVVTVGRTLANVGTDGAYLAKSTWGDPTWLGTVDEFNIYDGVLSACDIRVNYALGPVPIPEPATMLLLGLGSLVLVRRRK